MQFLPVLLLIFKNMFNYFKIILNKRIHKKNQIIFFIK